MSGSKTAPRPRPGGREIVVRASLMLGSLALGLALAEGAVRALGIAPELGRIEKGRFQLSRNPKIGYEPVPLDYRGDQIKFFDYKGASNKLGYRDRDHDVEKPEGVYRIVLIGDSIGAGLLVDDYEDTFPFILEKALLDAGRPVELINFSVSGYNTQQEVETLKDRGLAYDPDLVLVQFCLNDFYLDNGNIMGTLLDQELEQGSTPSARVAPILVQSELLRLISFRLKKREAPNLRDLAHEHEKITENTVAPSLKELASLAEAEGFDVLVGIFPAVRDLTQYRYDREHGFSQSVIASAGLPWVDLLEPMQTCAENSAEPFGYDIFHPTEVGHRCAGEALAVEIERRYLDGSIASRR